MNDIINRLEPDAFKFVYLWLHQHNGQSFTLAGVKRAFGTTLYYAKKWLECLEREGLAEGTGWFQESQWGLTTLAFNLFPVQPGGMVVGFVEGVGEEGEEEKRGKGEDERMGRGEEVLAIIPAKKNFFQAEEEDSYMLINNIKSPPPQGGDEKNFFQNLDALEKYSQLGSRGRRERLARLAHVTPAFVRAHACQFWHQETHGVEEGGMLGSRLEQNWPEPQLCRACWLEDHPVEPESEPDEPAEPEPKAVVPVVEPVIVGWNGVGMEPILAWQAVMGQLEMEMPKATFREWVRGCRLARYESGKFVILAHSASARAWCESRMTSTVVRILEGCCRREVEVAFVCEGGLNTVVNHEGH